MSHRPTFIDLGMETAKLWAKRGSCTRLLVGAALMQDQRIVAVSYNGSLSGQKHCDHSKTKIFDYTPVDGCVSEIEIENDTKDGRCTVALHAESNLAGWAARKGIVCEGGTLFVTHFPCVECSRRHIAPLGIKRVIWDQDYRVDNNTIDWLTKAGINIDKYKPGMI